MRTQNLSFDIGGPIKGYVEYDDKQKFPRVLFTVVLKGYPEAAQAIRKYLTTKRVFQVPMLDVENNGYLEETRVPTTDILYFEQALMVLGSEFGIFLA